MNEFHIKSEMNADGVLRVSDPCVTLSRECSPGHEVCVCVGAPCVAEAEFVAQMHSHLCDAADQKKRHYGEPQSSQDHTPTQRSSISQ